MPAQFRQTTPVAVASKVRRLLVRALALLGATAGLCAPAALLAQANPARPNALLKSKSVAEALALAGVVNPEPARRVLLDAPDIVIAGSVVQIRVISRMPGTDWIMLVAEGLPSPVVQVTEFTPGEGRSLSAKLVLTRTTRLRAITRSAGRYFSVSREVKVASLGSTP